MNYLTTTLCIIVAATIVTFIITESTERIEKLRKGKREFSWQQNLGYSLFAYTIIATFMWAIVGVSSLF